ncbi:MAG TPA: hypothetical protein VGL53_29175 [Bryobacteraceae bacterium]|jgi:hypothetical protein
MALNLPQEDLGAISTIRGLPPSSLERLVTALKAAPPISNAEEMVEHVAAQVPSVSKAKLLPILETIYSLYYIRELSGVRDSVFLDDLIEGITRDRAHKALAKDGSKLRAALERILDIESLHIVSKAARLQRDGERLFCTAKILSDIRPVFTADPKVGPSGAVLCHTLKLGYHEGKEHREFHVVLDSEDLEALAGAVERARSKDDTLRKVLREAKLPNLGA